MESIEAIVELLSDFSKIVGFNININRSTVFLHTRNK